MRHGSLAEAVRELGWSYRHAWGYLREAEARLGVPVIRTRAGKGIARGMELTEAGHLLMERLRALRERIDEAACARRSRWPPAAAGPHVETPGARRERGQVGALWYVD